MLFEDEDVHLVGGTDSGAMFVNIHPPPYKVNNKTSLLTWKSVTVSRSRSREKTIVFLCKQSGVAVAVAAVGSIPACLSLSLIHI